MTTTSHEQSPICSVMKVSSSSSVTTVSPDTRLARTGNYDVIVLDVMLPKRNGFSVCLDLRNAGVQTPLLMLTAKDGELDEVEGLDVGADDFLHKPFERSILIARIHALLRRQALGPAPALGGGASLA
jgi:two-component system OmpR family response regulator